jgi:hypothetical protein
MNLTPISFFLLRRRRMVSGIASTHTGGLQMSGVRHLVALLMALAWLPAMPSAHAEFGVAGSALAAMQYLDRFDRTACVSREKYNPPTPVGLPASSTFRQSDMARAARAKNQGCSTLTPLSAFGCPKNQGWSNPSLLFR